MTSFSLFVRLVKSNLNINGLVTCSRYRCLTHHNVYSTVADISHISADICSFSLTVLAASMKLSRWNPGATLFSFFECISNKVQDWLKMTYAGTILKKDHIPAAFASVIHAVVILCLLQPISVLVMYIWEPLNIMVTVPVWTSDTTCKKISALSVGRQAIVHKLLGLLAVDFNIDCEYWPLLRNVNSQYTSQESLKESYRTSFWLWPYISKHSDARRICRISLVLISLRIRSGLLVDIVFAKELVELSAFFFMIS